MLPFQSTRIHILKGLLLLFIACMGHSAVATHLMGSDITYRCLGNLKYEITLKLYRSCSGVNTVDPEPINIRCIETNSYISFPNLNRISYSDITGIGKWCPQKSKCQGSTPFPYGIEEHIYKGIITLPGGSCKQFSVSYETSSRNGAITTGGAIKTFYSEAIIFTDVGCNNSPVFTNPPAVLICVGQDFVFNHGAADSIDNDVFTYRLAEPLEGYQRTLPYISPYSYQNPLTYLGFPNNTQPLPGGFHIDSVTGDISFRPLVLNQATIVVVEVTEWRVINGVRRPVGIMRRDMQLIVTNCGANSPPVITIPVDTACVGEEICVPVGVFDANTLNKVTISWNPSIPGATLNILKSVANPLWDSAIVCWTPQKRHARPEPYLFTITATDDACPISGKAIKSGSIYVPPVATASFTVNDSVQCIKNHSFNFINTTPNKNAYTHKWLFSDGISAQSIDFTGKTFTNPGNYTVKLVSKTARGCGDTATKTVTVKSHLSPYFATGTYCAGSSYILVPAVSGGIFSGKNVNGTIYTPATFGADTLRYSVTKNGCAADTAIPVWVNPPPLVSFTINKKEQCFSTHLFDFTNTSVVVDTPFTTKWSFSNGVINNNKNITGLKFASSGTYSSKLTLVSPKGCVDSAEEKITVYPEPNASFNTLDTTFCANATTQTLIPAQPGGLFSGKNVKGTTYMPLVVGKDSVTYLITVNGCSAKHTQYTSVLPLPKLEFKQIHCFTKPVVFDAAFPNSSYLWHDGSTLPSYIVTAPGTYHITLYNSCDTLEKEIIVGDCFYSVVPNVFTPNGDGLNDVFVPFIANAEAMHLQVFSRWGEKLFETKTMGQGWDGYYNESPAPDGVYMWILEVDYYNDKNILVRSNGSGNIMLLR